MESYIRHTHSLNLSMNDQQRLQFSKVCFKIFLTHCSENSIYVFPEKELRSLSANFHIHVSVSDLYISRIGPHILLQQNRQTDPGKI
jgi:hypothetical protein